MKLNNCKIVTLEKYKNGTATAKVRLLHSNEKVVRSTTDKDVIIDTLMLSKIKQDFNAQHRRILGVGKRYPRMVLEHISDRDNVVGKMDSPITMAKEMIDGKYIDCLYCNILFMDSEIVRDVEDKKLNGVSVKLDCYKNGKYVIDDLTITAKPALEHTVLLSEEGQKVQITEGTEYARKLLEISERVDNLKISEENAKLITNKKNFLLKQANYNKITKADAMRLSKSDTSLQSLQDIFKTVAPVKLNKTTSFRRL